MSCLEFDDWVVPDPTARTMREAMWLLRYSPASSISDRYRVLAMAEAYSMLCTHPAGTEAMVKKLRAIRKRLREV